MAKYRGADGWLHDDSVNEPQRYTNKESTQGQSEPSEVEEAPSLTKTGADELGGCCFLVGTAIVCPLLGMGIGQLAGGLGGLFIGLGTGLAVPIGIFIVAVMASPKDPE